MPKRRTNHATVDVVGSKHPSPSLSVMKAPKHMLKRVKMLKTIRLRFTWQEYLSNFLESCSVHKEIFEELTIHEHGQQPKPEEQ